MKKILYFVFAAAIMLSSCTSNKSKFEGAVAEQNFDKAHEYYSKIKSHDKKEARKCAKTLFRAEAAYLLSQGEIARVESLATELDQQYLYNEVLKEEIPNMIKQKKYDAVVDILAAWPFEQTFEREAINVHLDHIWSRNSSYNDEMSEYNAIVDNLLTAAILDEDITIIRKCIKLYGPTATLKSKIHQQGYGTNYYDLKFELSYQDREDAKKEVASAGIEL